MLQCENCELLAPVAGFQETLYLARCRECYVLLICLGNHFFCLHSSADVKSATEQPPGLAESTEICSKAIQLKDLKYGYI